MDDAEIRAQLKELGEKCGPLTATTRKIYIKKIEKLRAAKGLTNPPPQVSKIATPKKTQPQVVIEDSSDEEDDEPTPEAQEDFTFKKPNFISENDINMADPADLTNDDIIKVLRFYGIRHGPVNPQTRKVYHKKIREAQGESQTSSLLEFSTDDEPVQNSQLRQERQAQKVFVRKSPRKSPKKAVQVESMPEPDVIELFSSSDDDDLPGMVDMGTSCLEPSILVTPERTEPRTPLRERNATPSGLEHNITPMKQSTSKISPLATETNSPSLVYDRQPIVRPRNVKRTPPRQTPSVKRRSEEGMSLPQPSAHRSPPPPNRHASILTQAPQPPEKRQRTERGRTSESIEDTFAIRMSYYLPFIALGGFFFIVGTYCFKAGLTILPDISEEVESNDQTPMEFTDIGDNIKSKIVDVFNQVEYNTRMAVCDYSNILAGPKDVSKLTSLSSLNFGNEINEEITKEIMSNENIANFLTISEDGFVSLNDDGKLDLGFTCQAVKVLTENYFTIQVATFFFALSFIASYFWKKVAEKKRKSEIEIQQVVREIIDCLQNHSARNGPTGASIERIRDQIIPMGDDTLAKLWPKAVSSIKRDIRLRTELKTVNGEEGEYWAWIDSSIKAHDEKTTRVAALAECLKIRNLLAPKDQNKDEHDLIRKTILNWCSGLNGIYDIELVPEDGTVYIKCSSCEMAGKAYERMRANWYKRNLIQIKYIKLSVYHRRFKNSVNKNTIIA
ncbi:unnamed protein product [Oikopleura dioica]|uniref:LEM domain-containing protein n=1 Tax=Oikopleura dioica TaxID=34765 RepID=E4WXM2_OIKDI|nr:unnamed protein product [Oikopleura dioica]